MASRTQRKRKRPTRRKNTTVQRPRSSAATELFQSALADHQAERFDRASQGYQRILRLDPQHADATHLLGVLAHQQGRQREALEWIEKAIQLGPAAALYRTSLGAVHEALGQFDDAIRHFEVSLQMMPQNADAYLRLGSLLQSRGRYQEAESVYRRAIENRAANPVILNNLGNVLVELDRPIEALDLYRRAIALQPSYVDARYNLATTLARCDDNTAAIAEFKQVLQLAPNHAQAWNNLGVVLRNADRLQPDTSMNEAMRCFQETLRIVPNHVSANANVADALEHLSDLDQARLHAGRALESDPSDVRSHLVLAKCDRRRRDIDAAIERLEALSLDSVDDDLRKDVLFELGRLYDHVKRIDEAMEAFQQGNRIAETVYERYGINGADYHQTIRTLKQRFTRDWVDSWSDPVPVDASKDRPIFLVGFPRSGTTLLERILDSHSRLHALEEKPAVLAVEAALDKLPSGSPDALATLDADQVRWLRRVYWQAVDQCGFQRTESDKILLDKFPLSIVRLGTIARVFPNAKIILALRHPFDVCLSCFMQDFGPNVAMANFCSLENAAKTYALVMSLWLQYHDVLPLTYHVIRYEDVVENMEAEVRRLLAFLELPWDDEVLEYARQSDRKHLVTTPSYHQVTQKIYTRSRFRWERYREHLLPAFEPLNRFLHDFGYSSR